VAVDVIDVGYCAADNDDGIVVALFIVVIVVTAVDIAAHQCLGDNL